MSPPKQSRRYKKTDKEEISLEEYIRIQIANLVYENTQVTITENPDNEQAPFIDVSAPDLKEVINYVTKEITGGEMESFSLKKEGEENNEEKKESKIIVEA